MHPQKYKLKSFPIANLKQVKLASFGFLERSLYTVVFYYTPIVYTKNELHRGLLKPETRAQCLRYLKDLGTMTSTSLHLSPHCPPTARHSYHTAQLNPNAPITFMLLQLCLSYKPECHLCLPSIQRIPYRVRPGSRVSFSLCLLCLRGNCWFL